MWLQTAWCVWAFVTLCVYYFSEASIGGFGFRSSERLTAFNLVGCSVWWWNCLCWGTSVETQNTEFPKHYLTLHGLQIYFWFFQLAFSSYSFFAACSPCNIFLIEMGFSSHPFLAFNRSLPIIHQSTVKLKAWILCNQFLIWFNNTTWRNSFNTLENKIIHFPGWKGSYYSPVYM